MTLGALEPSYDDVYGNIPKFLFTDEFMYTG